MKLHVKRSVYKKIFYTVALTLAVVSGCQGYRIRSGSTGKSSDEISKELGEIGINLNDANQQSVFAKIDQMMKTPGASTYFSEAPGQLGTLEQVMPLLGASTNQLMSDIGAQITGSIQFLEIFYVHIASTDGFRGGLILAGRDQTPSTPWFQILAVNEPSTVDPATSQPIQPGSIVDGEFEMRFNFGSTQSVLILRSDDLDSTGEDLTETIQLKVYYQSQSSGGEVLMGKINTLESF